MRSYEPCLLRWIIYYAFIFNSYYKLCDTSVFYINFVVMVNFYLELKNVAASFEMGFCDGIMLL